MLVDLLDESLIRLGVEARGWESAVRASAAPLVEGEVVSGAYVDDIVRAVRELGPYVVIAPGVALPHARPESGALRNALGVSVLESPVEFGVPEFDPVRFLFPLSSTDSDGHLGAIKSLVELVAVPEFLERLADASTAAEVMDLVREMEGAA